MNPSITIGIATHNDAKGLWMTIQHLKLFHKDSLSNCSFVVVDQNPSDPKDNSPSHGKENRNLILPYGGSGCLGAKYVPYTDRVGTSAGRDQIFAHAEGDIVIVLDSHVMLPIGVIERVSRFFSKEEHALDILSGPILTNAVVSFENPDQYSVMATHYADHWRSEMWGIWASAYQCAKCSEFKFSTAPKGSLVQYETLEMNPQPLTRCPVCNTKFPLLDWVGHERNLNKLGYLHLGIHGTEPFEIPGQGLGMFACKREAWPGFNKDAWGFGGEELYIHEKFRQNGGKAYCDPKLVWLHDFSEPVARSYPNTRWYKCRNYVLEFLELGRDLQPIKDHFVPKFVPIHEWEAMVKDPYTNIHGPTSQFKQPVMVDGKPMNHYTPTLEEVFQRTKSVKRDLDQHLDLLRSLAEDHTCITEFTKRKESTIAFLCGGSGVLRTYTTEPDRQHEVIATLSAREFIGHDRPSTAMDSILETELLYIDTVHHADYLQGELDKFLSSVTKTLVIRGTGSFGNKAEGGGPGLFIPLRNLINTNPEWFVLYHTNNQYGMTVLSKDQSQRPANPILPWPPGKGPGTELMKILDSIGIKESPTCDCAGKANQMDVWGVSGCKENRDTIIQWIREGQEKWGWKTHIDIASNLASTNAGTPTVETPTVPPRWKLFLSAVTTGLFLNVNWFDPIPGLVDLAIKNAEHHS